VTRNVVSLPTPRKNISAVPLRHEIRTIFSDQAIVFYAATLLDWHYCLLAGVHYFEKHITALHRLLSDSFTTPGLEHCYHLARLLLCFHVQQIDFIMISLKGKVIAVTGGASGIGLAVVKLIASLGAKVSVADLKRDSLDNVALVVKEQGDGEIFTMVVDVREKETVELWIKETVKWGGKLDGAANIAGVIGKGHGKTAVCSSA
jgi:NADPH:quinone reductase-like Zn-dependent oxidoreductase